MEILIVDGANSEKNKQVTEQFKDKRIKYVNVEPDAVDMYSSFGMQHSRNVGCKLAKGKYIAMLDDDDIWDATKIEKQVKVFEGNEKLRLYGVKELELALVICYNTIVSSHNEQINAPKMKPNYEDLLVSFNLSSTSTFIMRRDVLEEVGWWNEKLRGMHEYDIALKIAKRGYQIYTVPEILVKKSRFEGAASYDYFIKMAEIFDFWKYYGKELIANVGVGGLLFDFCKTLGIFFFFFSGYLFKDTAWDIVYLIKNLLQPRD
jgi:glycosyltransferase involved in cell wall biosynthesis